MDTQYQDHLIETITNEIPDSNRWSAKVIVSWFEGSRKQSRQFDGPLNGFASKAEAESWGIQFGKKWINDGKPPLR